MIGNDYEKRKRNETIALCKGDIEFYGNLKKQMQERKDKSRNEKNIEILSEIIKNCTKEIIKARRELKALL